MPSSWDQHVQPDAELATELERARNVRGPGHDRIHGDDPIPGFPTPVAMDSTNVDNEVDITAGQKMISAMSGSLLTSLLGGHTSDAITPQLPRLTCIQ